MLDEGLYERFGNLTDKQKCVIIAIGVESFLRAWTFYISGWSTLKGGLYYIDERSPALIDTFLHAIGGSKAHRPSFGEFMQSEMCGEMSATLHPVLSLFEAAGGFKDTESKNEEE